MNRQWDYVSNIDDEKFLHDNFYIKSFWCIGCNHRVEIAIRRGVMVRDIQEIVTCPICREKVQG